MKIIKIALCHLTTWACIIFIPFYAGKLVEWVIHHVDPSISFDGTEWVTGLLTLAVIIATTAVVEWLRRT